MQYRNAKLLISYSQCSQTKGWYYQSEIEECNCLRQRISGAFTHRSSSQGTMTFIFFELEWNKTNVATLSRLAPSASEYIIKCNWSCPIASTIQGLKPNRTHSIIVCPPVPIQILPNNSNSHNCELALYLQIIAFLSNSRDSQPLCNIWSPIRSRIHEYIIPGAISPTTSAQNPK